MKDTFELRRRTDGGLIVPHVEVAATFWSRFVGLQARRALPADHALLIAPCNAIHTCFVRFAIDVAFLDQQGTVLEIRRQLHPWRVAGPVRGSRFVLEMASGEMTLAVGDRVRLVPRSAARPKCSQHFRGLLSDE